MSPEITTREHLAELPDMTVVLDAFAAICIKVPLVNDDGSGIFKWRRFTPAVRNGEHWHTPYLPAEVVYEWADR